MLFALVVFCVLGIASAAEILSILDGSQNKLYSKYLDYYNLKDGEQVREHFLKSVIKLFVQDAPNIERVIDLKSHVPVNKQDRIESSMKLLKSKHTFFQKECSGPGDREPWESKWLQRRIKFILKNGRNRITDVTLKALWEEFSDLPCVRRVNYSPAIFGDIFKSVFGVTQSYYTRFADSQYLRNAYLHHLRWLFERTFGYAVQFMYDSDINMVTADAIAEDYINKSTEEKMAGVCKFAWEHNFPHGSRFPLIRTKCPQYAPAPPQQFETPVASESTAGQVK